MFMQADNKGKNVPEAENNQMGLCCQGKHTLILDEEIGIKCTCCSFVRLEIDSVFPPVVSTANDIAMPSHMLNTNNLSDTNC